MYLSNDRGSDVITTKFAWNPSLTPCARSFAAAVHA